MVLELLPLICTSFTAGAPASGRSGLPIVPCTVGDDMRREGGVKQRDAFSFLDGNGGLLELRIVHLHLIAGTCIARSIRRSAAGHQEQREHTVYSHEKKHFLQHDLSLSIFLFVRRFAVSQSARRAAV